MISRRNLLKTMAGSSLVLGVDAAAPYCLRRAAAGFKESAGDTILVVIQLSGGNDGLNTIIPIDNDAYRQARPELAISKAEAISVSDSIAMHPALREVASLLEDGLFTVMHGVGYEQPNRSHFESMDIWHTCRRKT
ncbi:MAG: hypothetical protein NXI32_07650, partial [bacterium]|nr:hypothetical protein [bacterium]